MDNRTLVFLPATEPFDDRYGQAPAAIQTHPHWLIHHVRFARMVWYNAAVRQRAVEQIETANLSNLVLVGFSKSGLGAWNMAMALANRVKATVIFDSPMCTQPMPSYFGGGFYQTNAQWCDDLPSKSVTRFAELMPRDSRLILIGGEGFSEDMRLMSRLLNEHDVSHTHIDQPCLKHHWNSGWLAMAFDALARD